MAINDKDKKPQSLASMAEEIRELRRKVEARNAGTDEASQKQKERMAALKKRMSEDVRNDPNAGGRQMPKKADQPQESKSSAQQANKSPAATTKVEQANFKDESNVDWKQQAGSEKIKGSGRVQKGIAKGRMNRYVGEGRAHSYNNYMAEEEKKKKGESNVVGS